ncbi:hypothetical protein PVAND_002493 [Polypedilum vanderplanki]|uniref:Lipase domain-containing protein n=1 Tax=Polypedilum vanderplanki TaxID=319348 RepID=A0A9J6BRM3_POLVA|nr:hypothetical protein PVAND_002493 [Polypedilum vanderplanki]
MKIFFVVFSLIFAIANSAPAEDPENINPKFDAYRDTRLLLQTRRNRLEPVQINFRNENSLLASPFDPSKPTRFLIHGWRQDDESDISTETSLVLLNHYDYNVIFVDWSLGAGTINYIAAAGRVEPVGFFVASQLNWMRENNFVNFDTVGIIGFSLGAHIAGHIGKNTNGLIDTIIGLDPAGPLFAERRPDGRINTGDARYVECLHTNGGLTGAGIGAAICDADFFPNGGSSQPGCLLPGCSHGRAVDFYMESIQRNGFHSVRCDTERQASRENCNSGGGQWFGGEPSNSRHNLRGIFSFRTNRNPPFSQGPWLN